MFRKSRTPKTTRAEIAALRELSAEDLLRASGGNGTPSPKTSVPSRATVKDTNIVVCSPTICF
jgi:hypothetical protein